MDGVDGGASNCITETSGGCWVPAREVEAPERLIEVVLHGAMIIFALLLDRYRIRKYILPLSVVGVMR